MRISTTRFACTCFAPPLSITNNSDSDYNLIQPPLWHCASGRFFDASAKQGPPRILLFRASDFRSTSSAPVLNGSRNSWTARNKSKRTYWGNSVSSASFIRNPVPGHTQIAIPTKKHRSKHTTHQTVQHPTLGRKLVISSSSHWIAANRNRVRR